MDIKTARRLAFLSLALLALASCDFLSGDSGPRNLRPGQFYTIDMQTKKFKIVGAERLWEGDACVIWAEKGAGVTEEEARKLADEFDNSIRPALLRSFGMDRIVHGKRSFDNILSFANYLAGGDSPKDQKLTLLLLNIKGNNADGPQVAGYFYSGDFMENRSAGASRNYSNGRDMIYVDVSMMRRNWDLAFRIVAHELMHLINFASAANRSPLDPWSAMPDTWADEALAMTAEQAYFGKDLADRISWFMRDPEGTLARGNNFFVWGNHGPGAVLDDYATAYLFFKWLGLQAQAAVAAGRISEKDRDRFFYEMAISQEKGTAIVTEQARRLNEDWKDWAALLSAWLAANRDPANPHFGYIGNADIFDGNAPRAGMLADGERQSLFPGEGVFSAMSGAFSVPASSGNIRYFGLSQGEPFPGASRTTADGEALLTFNANSNSGAPSEIGRLTGVPAPKARDLPCCAFDEPADTMSVSAWDLLGRDFEKGPF